MPKRLLFIDDDFEPTVRSGAEKTLKKVIDTLTEGKFNIGPSDFAGYTRCPDKMKDKGLWDFGLSVCTPLQNSPFDYPVDKKSGSDLGSSEFGSMFFAADAACAYFREFVLNKERWEEIDAVIIDIMMSEGTFLPGKYKNETVNDDNAGDYLRKYLGELVSEYRIPQNDNTVLPVMVLTNKQLKISNGLIHEPKQESKDRLLVWGMEKEYATKNIKSFIDRINWLADRRVQ